MTPERYREVEGHLRSLDDDALRRLVYLEASHYEPDALDIAYDEAHKRGMEALWLEEYAARFPAEWLEHVGFCHRCWTETTDESPGWLVRVLGIGPMLLVDRDPCPDCGSFVARKWFCVVLPIVPLGWYRVRLQPRTHRYALGPVGRRLKRQP